MASAHIAANGLKSKFEAKVTKARRRPHGLRRWFPVPAWKRSIFSNLVGAITGLGLAVVMPQAGVTPLSLANAASALTIGSSFGLGSAYSLGVIKTPRSPCQEN